ncbi:hypothetical protein LINPERPRIM_LOCUS25573 [Linum perenne]
MMSSAARGGRSNYSSSNYNLRNLLGNFYYNRSETAAAAAAQWRQTIVANVSSSSETRYHKGLQLISSNNPKGRRFFLDDSVRNKPVTLPTSSLILKPRYSFTSWVKWVLGTILTIVLPFWKHKWERMKTIETEVVEQMATVAENLSSEAAEIIPSTNGRLKEAALVVERISKTTAHEAHVARDFLLKLEKLQHDFDDLEKMVQPNPNPNPNPNPPHHHNPQC